MVIHKGIYFGNELSLFLFPVGSIMVSFDHMRQIERLYLN